MAAIRFKSSLNLALVNYRKAIYPIIMGNVQSNLLLQEPLAPLHAVLVPLVQIFKPRVL